MLQQTFHELHLEIAFLYKVLGMLHINLNQNNFNVIEKLCPKPAVSINNSAVDNF